MLTHPLCWTTPFKMIIFSREAKAFSLVIPAQSHGEKLNWHPLLCKYTFYFSGISWYTPSLNGHQRNQHQIIKDILLGGDICWTIHTVLMKHSMHPKIFSSPSVEYNMGICVTDLHHSYLESPYRQMITFKQPKYPEPPRLQMSMVFFQGWLEHQVNFHCVPSGSAFPVFFLVAWPKKLPSLHLKLHPKPSEINGKTQVLRGKTLYGKPACYRCAEKVPRLWITCT